MNHYSNSKSLDSSIIMAKNLEDEKRLIREAYKPMIIRQKRKYKVLPRNYQDWIRQGNDQGVI